MVEQQTNPLENLVTMQYDQIFRQVYQHKKVFLTGHTGFKGSWMLAWLNKLGADVKGYALEPEKDTDLYWKIQGNDLCKSIFADIRDKERLRTEIIAFEPDFIFHFAAQPLVRDSYEKPIETFDVNVMGTIMVLDALRFLKKPCAAIIITTDKVYENKEWYYPYREHDTLGGHDPYSASKAMVEISVNAYRNSFFNMLNFSNHHKVIATARAGNVIGAGDWAKDRIVPDIIRAFQQNKEIEVRNPSSVRPWQHVLEPLSGYLLLGCKAFEVPDQISTSWNFGPLEESNLRVEDLVKEAINIWGGGTYLNKMLPGQMHEANLLKLDINKAINKLGWYPKWDAKEALRVTIKGYENLTLAYLLKDIAYYSEQ